MRTAFMFGSIESSNVKVAVNGCSADDTAPSSSARLGDANLSKTSARYGDHIVTVAGALSPYDPTAAERINDRYVAFSHHSQ